MLAQRHTVKSILDFNEARDDQVLGWQLMPLPSNNLITGICGINWTWCKQSAPHFRQITTSSFNFIGQMLFLMSNQ